MDGMMRQMVMTGPRKSRIIDVLISQFSDDEVLVKVTLTGMCHSVWYSWAAAKDGDLLGHEAACGNTRQHGGCGRLRQLGTGIMEVLHGLELSSRDEMVYRMTTPFRQPAPLPMGYTDQMLDSMRCDAEGSLV